LRARVAAELPVQRGDQIGLAFDATQVSLFDAASGRALRTARHDEPAREARAPSARPAMGAAHG